nr:putative e3 ubiquitin ligase complex scf subunit sconb [Quercus suber]
MASLSRNHTSPPLSLHARPSLPDPPPMFSAPPPQRPIAGGGDGPNDVASHVKDELYRHDHSHDHDGLRHHYRKDLGSDPPAISLPSTSKQAEQTVAPFLTKHIPEQYNPVSAQRAAAVAAAAVGPQGQETEEQAQPAPNSTKFCYRHRPDLKCRRQANEPSMEQLQNGLASLSQADQQAISHVWSLFSAAPAKHRNLMLQGILTQCCFPQLSFISASIRDLIKIDFLAALPSELGFRILCFLDTASLCRAAQVSQRWRSLADDDVVWHKMCEQHIDRKCTKCGWGLPLLERKRLRIEKRQIQLRATGKEVNGTHSVSPTAAEEEERPAPKDDAQDGGSPGPGSKKRSIDSGLPSPEVGKRQCTSFTKADQLAPDPVEPFFPPTKRLWKDIYKDRFKVGTAWKYGRCSTKVFKGHTNGVMAVQFDDNVLISGSYDTTIKVWDINTGEELRTLKGHTSGIRCLQFDETKLMTGSLDNTLRLWNWRTGQCLRTFNAHTDGILSLHFSGRYVASGSMDKTIRVWDSESKQTFLLRGHTDWVNSVKVDAESRTLFSASDDLSVRLWDLDTRECIRIFEGHVGQVQQVVPMPAEFELDDDIVSDHDDDASSVSSAAVNHRRDSPAPAQPFWPHHAARPAPPRYAFTGALDSTIRLWDVHFSAERYMQAQRQVPAAALTSGTDFVMLPTDPLTNSHMPRAQACVRTFFGHVEGIWALAADHLRLVSGAEDRMMKVWDPRTGKCERTFTGHQAPVTCTWLSDSRVASGSEDCEVRMLVFGDVIP